LIVILFVTSCGSTREIKCGWANEILPISISDDDLLTDRTALEILNANEAHEFNCVQPTFAEKYREIEVSHP
jgi:hypothetical protein